MQPLPIEPPPIQPLHIEAPQETQLDEYDMHIVMPRLQEEPSMVLNAPREDETTINENNENIALQPIQSRIPPRDPPSDITELNESLDVEPPNSDQPTITTYQLPALRYNTTTSTLQLGDNPDTTVIQEYANDISNDMQNLSIIDLLENEESTLDSSLANEISDAEFNEIVKAQDLLLNLLGNYQFSNQSLKKTYKISQETLIDLYQNPSDYNTTQTIASIIYTNFLYEMIDIIKWEHNNLIINTRDETRLTLKWYNIAMLLRSKKISTVDVTYLASQTTRDVDGILQFLSSNEKYYLIIRDTEIKLHNDETARRRREQRHIYFRNLNARRRGTAGRRPAIR